MPTKTCITCHLTKDLDDFGTYHRYPDGKHRICLACKRDYEEQRRRAIGNKPIPPFLNRLWDNIQQCGHEDVCVYCCWPWLKTLDVDGYGKFSLTVNGVHRAFPVTRIVFELWNTMPLPDEYCACHYCDNPSCCNPMHLWAGTRVDNRRDCVKKGRQAKGQTVGQVVHPEAFPRGEQCLNVKLTEADVHEIRALYPLGGFTTRELGKRYGVSHFAIRCILRRITWKHI